MFDKKTVHTYKSIIASDRLRKRVLTIESQTNTKITQVLYLRYRRVLACAAGLVFLLIIAFAATLNTPNITVLIDKKEIGYEPILVQQANQAKQSNQEDQANQAKQSDQANQVSPSVRNMPFRIPSVSVMLRIEMDQNTKVTVSNGTLARYDEIELDVPISDTLQLSKDELIIWKLSNPSMKEISQMTLKTKGKTLNYLLEWDESSENWTIRLEKGAK